MLGLNLSLGLGSLDGRTLTQRALAAIKRAGGTVLLSGLPSNYFDSVGTTPAQVDQPVGLVLDGAGSVGPELFNVTLNFSDAAWAKTAAVISTGANTFTTNGGGGCHAYVAAPGTKTYAVRVVGTTTVSTTFRNAAGTSGAFTVPAGAFDTGANSQILLENGSLYIQLASAGTINITSIIIKEITGNHATQATVGSKPTLRRWLVNQLTQSDFQNGVTDAPTRGGLVTASTLAGYGGALAFGHNGSTVSFGYKTFVHTSGTTYTFAAVVAMDDGNAPTFATVFDGTSSANSFALVTGGAVVNPTTITSTLIATGVYLVCGVYVASGVGSNYGVIKYSTNNNRTFKVTRYCLYQGTVTAQQILAAGGIPLTTTAPASSALGNYWWQFDPAAPGDFLRCSSTIFTLANDDGFVCAGVTPNAVTGLQTVVASRGVSAVPTASANSLFLNGGKPMAYWEGGVAVTLDTAAVTAGTKLVMSARRSAGVMQLRVNGSVAATSSVALTEAAIGNLAIGSSLSGTSNAPLLPATCSISVVVVCKGQVPDADAILIERWVGSLQGQTL